MGTWDYGVREAELPWQTTRSVPILLKGEATKWRQLCQPIRPKTYSSLRTSHQPQEPATIARDRSLQSTKGNYSLLVKENVFLNLYAMVFEVHNLKKK